LNKVRIATAWLSGCSGCHMSFLNIDEALMEVASKVEFVRSPLVDAKEFRPCEVAIVEGAVSDTDNLETLKSLRANCKILVALGDCAVFGGMTSMRNLFDAEDVLKRGYVETETTKDGFVPVDPPVPRLLEQATPLSAHVKVDVNIPGCPPHPESILHVVTRLLEGKDPKLPRELLHFDSRIKVRSDGK